MPTYKRPPITEAVIELQYASKFSEKVVRKAAGRLAKDYLISDDEFHFEYTFDTGPEAPKSEVKSDFNGVKLSSLDRNDIIVLRTGRFSCSRLGPYDSWNAFFERFQSAWSKWKRAAGPLASQGSASGTSIGSTSPLGPKQRSASKTI